MRTLDEIKSIFSSLSGYQQECVLEGLLQEHELQGKVLKLATLGVLEDRGEKPCPYCSSNKMYRRGKQSNVQVYQCQSEKWYSDTTGIPLWDIKLKSKWQGYLRCMEQGMALKATAEKLKICIQTSFDWHQKILSSPNKLVSEKLSGIVESDEFEITLSHKGQRNLDRKLRKRGTDFKRNSEEEVTVVQVVTRGGETYLKAFESKRLTTEEITRAFDEKLAERTFLITDSHNSYKSFAKDHVNKKDKTIHVQTANNKHNKLKQFLDPFNDVSSKYFQNYLNWFAYAEKMRETKKTIKQ